MRICPVCRREFENETMCPSCMVPLIDTELNQAVNVREEEQLKKKQDKENRRKGRKGKSGSDGSGVELPGNTGTADSGASGETPQTVTQEPAGGGAYEETPQTAMPEAETGSAQKEPKRFNASEKRFSSSGMSVSFDPKLIVIIVVAALIVVALIFVLKGRSAKKSAVSDFTYATTDEVVTDEIEEADTAEGTAEPEETEEAEKTDLSNVDIDAVSNSYAQFTGTLATRGDEYMVKLSEASNIYAYNDSGETAVMNNVNQIILNETGGWGLDAYVDSEVTVGGYLEIRDQDMTMTMTEFEGPGQEEDTAIHSYQIMISDCTWSEAMQKAQDMGGYLVRINTREEYDYIISRLNEGDYTKYHFYLGGRRDSGGSDYYWVDAGNQFIGDCLNDSSSWCQSAWFDGEPSFADGDVSEDSMNLFCVSGTWYLNDASMDLVGNYPDLLTGKVGYIVEIE